MRLRLDLRPGAVGQRLARRGGGLCRPLCAALGLLAGTLDFFAFCRAHRALADMRGRVSVSLDGLPQTGDFIQADWRALVLEAHHACRAAEERAAAQRREADDYYTLWAHQIKTPIAALELLLQDPQGPHVQALAAELVKVEQYVDMALNFMRLEGEGSDLVISRCALAPIVKAAVRRYARLFILKGIRLELGSLEGEALTDGKWLGFALEQLISNAVKYTPSGGHVRIWVQEGPAVLVEDDGPGIPAQGPAPGVRPGLYRPGRPHRRPFHRHRPVPYPQGPECPGPCRIPFLPARPGRLRQGGFVGQAPGPGLRPGPAPMAPAVPLMASYHAATTQPLTSRRPYRIVRYGRCIVRRIAGKGVASCGILRLLQKEGRPWLSWR